MPVGGGGNPQKRKRALVQPQGPSGCTMCPRDNFLHPFLCKKSHLPWLHLLPIHMQLPHHRTF